MTYATQGCPLAPVSVHYRWCQCSSDSRMNTLRLHAKLETYEEITSEIRAELWQHTYSSMSVWTYLPLRNPHWWLQCPGIVLLERWSCAVIPTLLCSTLNSSRNTPRQEYNMRMPRTVHRRFREVVNSIRRSRRIFQTCLVATWCIHIVPDIVSSNGSMSELEPRLRGRAWWILGSPHETSWASLLIFATWVGTSLGCIE